MIRSRVFYLGSFLSLFLMANVFIATPPAHAGVWGESIAATLLDQVLTTIKEQIKAAIVGTLKVAATTVLNSQVGQLVGGTSAGNALFITDWSDYLFNEPGQNTMYVMNDWFSRSTRGKHSSVNYTGIGDRPSVAGNYPGFLVAYAQRSIPTDGAGEQAEGSYDLDEYAATPTILFENGNYRAFNALISNPYNNPYGFTMMAEGQYAATFNRQQEMAKTMAQSSGFRCKMQNGACITPAATIADMVSNAQNIGNNMIAAAQEPGQLLSGVVNAVVNKAMTSLIQKGIGQVQSAIQREMNRVDKQVNAALNRFNQQLGPAAKFLRETSQRTDVNIKPYVPPPTVCVGSTSC